MPQHPHTAPVCRDCDGFATATITTGNRHTDGSRATLRVTCVTCQGTGHTTIAAARVRVGK
ncbi:hypothetical protein [Streptomyces thermolilacinus]|uniref:Uncharacterized protein n=1 Tax=Streptomyces thermolilacinus SPC6 TaxID=1306406 RepID=A0A1D3DT45_9ACTN|nr:hypothetical protein [Streptomyces thermolilacinus]OEJ95498.1 hypothetical protein J116_014430 [Streptomyces thermolilacinus SPC6]